MDADGEMGIVDFDYNRVRPYDDVLNGILDDYFGFNFYELPLVATGGNVMTDGQGKMMSTTLILTENDGIQTAQVTEYAYTQPQIENLVEQYLGVEDYYFFTDPLSNSTIDHIDCHAKLLDVDKVMIARVPVGHTNYAALEAVVDAWEAKTSSYGTPYQIFRVDQTSNNEPYANSFIYNGKIYVPQWNPSASASDLAAISAYQAAMPGFTVQGYYNSSFLSDDAAHCRVNTIFDEQMVFARHIPPTSAMASSSIALNVEISHSNALDPSATYIAYRHSTTGAWQNAALTYVSGDLWTANVPTPALGQRLYYYILATDTTTRYAKLPLCGASDPFEILIDIPAPNTAPTIVLPESITYAEDGSLIVDFGPFVADAESPDSSLSLNYSGNSQISVSVAGMNVTFSAAPDWHGTEMLNFVVSDGELTANDNVNVIVSSVTDPAIIGIDPLSLDFGVVTVGSTEMMPFTITNYGEATLSGSITTPVGFTVALATGRSSQATFGLSDTSSESRDLHDRNTLSYDVASGVTNTYNLSFSPTSEADYSSSVSISSNDPDHSIENIVVTGSGFIPNTAPAIDLPQSFSFDENGTLEVDFSAFVSDVDNDPLTLGYSGNTNVIVAIDGLSVTFTATQDWDGSEVLTFTVSDAEDTSSDTAEIIVNNVNVPPTIDLPDTFDFDENGSLVVNFGPYVEDADGETLTLGYSGNTNVIVAIDGLSVTFSAAPGWFGTEVLSFTVSDGTDTGMDQVSVTVNYVVTYLATPTLTVEKDSQGMLLHWNAITDANKYLVFRCEQPYGTYTQITQTDGTTWSDTDDLPTAFYYVRAVFDPTLAK